VLELLLPLTVGARVEIVSRALASDGQGLGQHLEERGATLVQATPSSWRLLGQAGWQGQVGMTLLSGGEALTREVAEQLGRGGARVWNMYGPTETTIWSAVQEIRGGERVIGIGSPIAQTQLYVLDEHLEPVPVGVRGMLYIGGAGVGHGYVRRGETSAEQFVPDPFRQQEGARMYRTGDVVRRHGDGTLEWVGRQDQQVKLRGYRIELGEIEAVLERQEGIEEAVVVLWEEEAGAGKLVAYLQSPPQAVPSLEEVRAHLRARLPVALHPAQYVWMQQWPLTPNGKLDRRALPAPTQEEHGIAQTSQAPRTALEEVLAASWAEVLKRSVIRRTDHFFELGGHSLLATQLASRLRAHLHVAVPLRMLFEAPRLEEQARRIEALLRGGEPTETELALVPVSRSQALPLSFAQQRLWFLAQFDPSSTAYHIPFAARLGGAFDLEAFVWSLQEVVRRHEILRTTFEQAETGPVQIIHPVEQVQVPCLDLSQLAAEERASEVQRLVETEARQPFDLERGPLWRATVVRLGVREHALLFTMHHIISDGWSNGVLMRELGVLYSAFLAGRSSPLPDLPIQYADFALWQRQWLRDEELERQLAYWEEQLGEITPLNLPTDWPRPLVQTFQGAQCSRLLTPALSEALKRLSQQENVTLFMLLLAAFQVLLACYSGQEEIFVGTTIANRNRAETEDLIGFFVNTLVLHTSLAGSPDFRQLLERVRETALGAYAHQDLPFEKLVEMLQPERDLSRSPLFQVMFILQNLPQAPQDLQEIQSSPLMGEEISAKFDLTLIISEDEGRLLCQVQYASDLFAQKTISDMLSHFEVLLGNLVADPEQPVGMVGILGEEERRAILEIGNGGQRDYVDPLCLPLCIIKQAERTPEAVALREGSLQLTYGQMMQQVEQVAKRLRASGVKAGSMVGVSMLPSIESVIALLALWYCGGAYVFLDVSWPEERRDLIIRETGVQVVVSGKDRGDNSPDQEAAALEIIRYGDKADTSGGLQTSGIQVGEQDLAYVLYTSGSTGNPKGVMVSHRAIANRVLWGVQETELDIQDRVLQVAGWGFDIFLWEVCGPLVVGGSLVLGVEGGGREVEELVGKLAEEEITVVHLVPSLLQMVLAEGSIKRLKGLRWILTGGERVSQRLAEDVLREVGAGVQQFYGPTEAAISVTCWRADSWDKTRLINLGRPIVNTQVYVLDEQMEPVPVGIVGEIYLGGTGVAWGYVGRGAWSGDAFVPDPYCGQQGARLYRTGDQGRWLHNGELEFLGRRDRQVKLRGYRIEPGEIEAVLEQGEGIEEAVVV
ncbi:MAG TPA: amino acid adenylation domain-containing protein, partial [Ktedonobacteraceae bacterium]|nr:amino acid adenylation domain-containing protein [Ktedonobacteraceae bacterium]